MLNFALQLSQTSDVLSARGYGGLSRSSEPSEPSTTACCTCEIVTRAFAPSTTNVFPSSILTESVGEFSLFARRLNTIRLYTPKRSACSAFCAPRLSRSMGIGRSNVQLFANDRPFPVVRRASDNQMSLSQPVREVCCTFIVLIF